MFFRMNRSVSQPARRRLQAVWKALGTLLSRRCRASSNSICCAATACREGYTLLFSKSAWETRDAFIAWTKSDNFRAAHRSAGENKAMYLGPPKFEGFTVVEGA